MIQTNKFLVCSIMVLALGLISSCNKNPLQTYIDEADELCEVYNTKSLEKMKLDISGGTNQIADATKKVVKSNKFLAIFKTLSTSGYLDYYAALQPKVSKLIGKQWHCKNMYNFYDFTWENANKKKDPSGRNIKLELRITSDGFIHFDNNRYVFKKNHLWGNALRNFILKEAPWEITIAYPENTLKEADTETLVNIFSELNVDSLRYNFKAYRISEYETLKKLGLKK